MAKVDIAGKTYEPDLVIFDKDGTLIDFPETWAAIIHALLEAMTRHIPVGDALRGRVERALGISVQLRTVDPRGPLAMGTFTECDALLTYCLYREGLRWDEAQTIVRTLGDEVFRSEVRARCIRPAQGALELLKRLKEKGLTLAVATNDRAADALDDMFAIGAAPYIDAVVGADNVEHSKPAPDMVEKICGHFSMNPSSSLLVGDTVMDALLGRNSGVMLSVGIPGITTRKDLEGYMDVVVDSLDEIT
ncbi:MAG TPA: HAD family hydrolase [Deltaproteobacteria bacterium]|nr:HAD family hydrolase [Deltaproteobacteria bacterium]